MLSAKRGRRGVLFLRYNSPAPFPAMALKNWAVRQR